MRESTVECPQCHGRKPRWELANWETCVTCASMGRPLPHLRSGVRYEPDDSLLRDDGLPRDSGGVARARAEA